MADQTRRAFFRTAAAAGAIATVGAVVTGTAVAAPASVPVAKVDPQTGDTVVTPGSPLVIHGSADLGHVRMRGGQIVISGGGVINIDRLTSE